MMDGKNDEGVAKDGKKDEGVKTRVDWESIFNNGTITVQTRP